MGLYVNAVSSTLATTRSLYQTSCMQTVNLKRLSSGIRINSASDDAAGLSLSQKLKSVINGNTIAKNNTQTAISMLNTADGALSVMTNSLQRIRDLAVQAANGIYANSERQMLQREVTQLSANMQQTYKSARFSDKNVFQGDKSGEYDAAIAAGYNDAHIITSGTDLANKISGHESEDFILVTDLNLSGTTYSDSVITNTFSGKFDGNGHIISNLKIDTGASAVANIGLFSKIIGGSVHNLGLDNVNIRAINGTTVGGMTGYMESGTISQCYTSGSVIGSAGGTGGLVGWNFSNSHVENTYSSADISGGWASGGLIGANWSGSLVESCYASGNVNNSDTDSGGLIGNNYLSQVKNCYSTGNIGSIGYSGGLIGYNKQGAITFSYATGNVISGATQQGLIGANTNGGTDDASNFYKNNMPSDDGNAVNANINPEPTGNWDQSVWDLSSDPPNLKNCGIIDGSISTAFQFQVGADRGESSIIYALKKLSLGDISFNISSQSSAFATIGKIDTKMTEINLYQSDVGASINRMQGAISIQDSRIVNISASDSTIKDTDIAIESAAFIKNQIRQQAGTSLLSQTQGLDKKLIMSLISL